MNEKIKDIYKIDDDVFEFVKNKSADLKKKFAYIEDIESYNQLKVLAAFQKNKLQATDFNSATGYGYGDVGRDKCEAIYRDVFKAEDALVRPSIASGTHALSLVLKGILLPGDQLLYISGMPYDTLQEVIGIRGDGIGSLKELGIDFDYVDLRDGKIDIKSVLKKIKPETKMIAIQRSTGYSLRNAITIEEMEEVIKAIKDEHPGIIIMVDNCYGEFTNTKEPIEIGCDVIAGSLIKNPGGGIAISGGYIAGRKDLIQRISYSLTAPGLGKEVGLSFSTTRQTLQGLFLAPKVTSEALKSAILFSKVFSDLGYPTYPKVDDERSDIICAIELGSANKVVEFCKMIQASSVVDSHVVPYPWDMPGYDDKIVMASGSFIDGSSIEISADGPLREPYVVYYQGGLSYYQAMLACMKVLMDFKEKGYATGF
ncbi:MAG: methionine gamma-lyase family protein [Finegoldia sp.]|nr:methionine gamma-lyase family protein [Finegoldia sp.]